MARTAASGRVSSTRIFSSVALNGTSQYILLNDQSAYNLSTFSVETWVKGASGQTTKAIFAEGRSSSANPAFRLATGGGGSTAKLSAFLRNDSNTIILNNTNSTTTVFDNAWHHIVWSDSNGTVTLYVDGVADATNFNYTRGTLTLNRSAFGSLITNNTPGSFLAGSVAICRLYNVALNQAQVTAAFTNSSSVLRSALKHELNFTGSPTTTGMNTGFATVPWQVVAAPTFSTLDIPTTNPLSSNLRTANTNRTAA